jgi:hypothetical protein
MSPGSSVQWRSSPAERNPLGHRGWPLDARSGFENVQVRERLGEFKPVERLEPALFDMLGRAGSPRVQSRLGRGSVGGPEVGGGSCPSREVAGSEGDSAPT